MSSPPDSNAPIRAGIFGEPDQAEAALKKLKENGFASEEISVVTSVREFQERFAAYLEQSHAGGDVENKSLTRAGAAGLGLGGAAALATLVTMGGASVFVIGAFSGIAMLETFVALMLMRSVEKETADFFDQELDKGNILVAIEAHGDDAEQRLNLADEILRDAGSKPIPLAEG